MAETSVLLDESMPSASTGRGALLTASLLGLLALSIVGFGVGALVLDRREPFREMIFERAKPPIIL